MVDLMVRALTVLVCVFGERFRGSVARSAFGQRWLDLDCSRGKLMVNTEGAMQYLGDTFVHAKPLDHPCVQPSCFDSASSVQSHSLFANSSSIASGLRFSV